MEVLLPVLAIIGLSLVGWIANVFLLVQFVRAIRQKRPHSTWSRAWGVVWVVFLLGLLIWRSNPNYLSWQAGWGNVSTVLTPVLWLGVFWQFRRSQLRA